MAGFISVALLFTGLAFFMFKALVGHPSRPMMGFVWAGLICLFLSGLAAITHFWPPAPYEPQSRTQTTPETDRVSNVVDGLTDQALSIRSAGGWQDVDGARGLPVEIIARDVDGYRLNGFSLCVEDVANARLRPMRPVDAPDPGQWVHSEPVNQTGFTCYDVYGRAGTYMVWAVNDTVADIRLRPAAIYFALPTGS